MLIKYLLFIKGVLGTGVTYSKEQSMHSSDIVIVLALVPGTVSEFHMQIHVTLVAMAPTSKNILSYTTHLGNAFKFVYMLCSQLYK